eukprot:CAMPEP_0204173760 /NCGR_PEP_ID=MMETSP0361-20130328/45284_1 /ASSEMBLY_ACC=CAM_ASM_000343 /TAXON_ID=268821 /ORGANISM="Scrippsiella Hangoei, Strain SHTV-5" /LENGTH=78 /DNA_ID=CAMNT_0051132107 /DNA_START=1204 /DNA_END=1440 /DNA_ORIENTATION=+
MATLLAITHQESCSAPGTDGKLSHGFGFDLRNRCLASASWPAPPASSSLSSSSSSASDDKGSGDAFSSAFRAMARRSG